MEVCDLAGGCDCAVTISADGQWEVRMPSGAPLKRVKAHEGAVNDIQVYKRFVEEVMFISASKDRTAKVRRVPGFV